MFRAFLDAGVTRVCADHVFLAMQQFVDLGNVCNVGCCTDHAVNQTRFVIDGDVKPSFRSNTGFPSWSGAFPDRAYRPCSWSSLAH